MKEIYVYRCPTISCEVLTITVSLYPELVEDFGFCCPFCGAHMELVK